MFSKQLNFTLVSILFPLMLTACQLNGSSKKDSADESNVEIGSFKGIPISGLRYSTATQNGLTNSEGQFQYQAGEAISFSFAGIALSEAIHASSEISLLNLVPNSEIYTTTSQITKLLKTPSSPDYLAFNKVNNLLTLLMSLDKDSNPDNGIQLSTEIENLALGLAFTFDLENNINRSSIETSNEIQLKRIMQKAAYDGLIQSGHSRKPGKALDDYYRIMSIGHDLAILSEERTEKYTDGVVIKRITYTYDTVGQRLTREITEPTHPDTQSSVAGFTYNDQGDILNDSFSRNNELQRRYIYTYDGNGNRLSSHNIDGDKNSVSEISYDEFGQILTINQELNGSGNNDVITTNTYDIKGNKLTYFYTQGGIDKKAYYSYDDSRNLLGYRFDSTGDGRTDKVGDYSYDNKGNLLAVKLDNTGDENYDEITTYTYNSLNKVLVTTYYPDGNSDFNKQEKNKYDAQGNVLSSSLDANGDGHPNSLSTSIYDSQGNQLSFSHDSNGNGEANFIYTITYDANGNRLTSSEDADGNGSIDKSVAYYYDTNNNLTRLTYDMSNNSVINEIHAFTYDEYNNLLTNTEDNDGDDTPELITHYQRVSTSWQGLLFWLSQN